MYEGPERRASDNLEARQLFEFRLLALERGSEERERRLKLLENEFASMNEKLKTIVRIDHAVDSLKEAQTRMMAAIIVAIVTVVGTFLIGHFGPIAH